jgi:4-carboxymuconolactone decarboxylase
MRLAVRLPPLAPAGLSSEQQTLYQDMRHDILGGIKAFKVIRDDGALMGPWNPYLHEPAIGRAAWELTRAIDQIAILPKKMREIAILVVAVRYQCVFQIHAHVAVAEGLGIPLVQLATLTAGLKPTGLAADESLAYDIAHALCAGSPLPEPLYRSVLTRFGQRGVNELIYLIGAYCMLAITLNAFDITVPERE